MTQYLTHIFLKPKMGTVKKEQYNLEVEVDCPSYHQMKVMLYLNDILLKLAQLLNQFLQVQKKYSLPQVFHAENSSLIN